MAAFVILAKILGMNLIITLALIPVIGILYQSTATLIDNYRYPPPGKLVDIGGYKLHLHSTGQGGPAVILDAGLSGTSLGWILVQAEASKFTRVCSYDRAGYAWSGASSSKRTSQNIVEELHTLLHKAEIPGPYILVGHSFGGCNMLQFAARYPDETFGVILVDSVHEDLPAAASTSAAWLLSAIGYQRLKGVSAEIEQMFQPLPEPVRRAYMAQMNKTGYSRVVAQEMECLPESLSDLRQVHLQDKPLIVITAGIPPTGEEGNIWGSLQKKLLAKSNRSKQKVAEQSDHMINHYQPKIIVDAIREMIETRSAPFSAGTF